ncbi:phosphatase PAP2 family protein [Streptomyces sp. OF3]|uniref:Phosphatase PAP2 family protein n=1 Tax=Streptomyces alkaliterrae TaxID=2213162 RepID=A0A7W3WHC1_9ACTN|nr:phosphatase PAP2 family protein [Streptomyces alkaliterrae]MBB1252323.1 phosphatase PAP2 family protein [Streptomyces alkaliterrae]
MFTAVVLMVLLLVTGWQVAAGGPLAAWDESVSRGLRQPSPESRGGGWAQPAADLGSVAVAVPVLAAAMAVFWWWMRRWWPVMCAAAAMAAVPLVVVPLKVLFDRPGPVSGSGYFPSGHTATAVVAYGCAALLVSAVVRSGVVRWAAASVAVLLVVATGAGLVRRAYHWPLDVLASCALGGLLLLAVALLSGDRGPGGRRPAGRRPRAWPVPGSPGR